jgi:predicted nucleic acid-binding protein
MLADSNLIIYAASGNYPELVNWFLENRLFVSAISLVETQGYHKLTPKEKDALDVIFSELIVIYPTPEVFQTATTLRQQRAISLGDALIAATALNLNLPLATHNTEDFTWIESLSVVDPMQA